MKTEAKKSKKAKTGHAIGLYAERMAEVLLRCKGYSVLERRYKTSFGEVDIIMRRANLLIFVEVKKRSTRMEAGEAINKRNRQRVSDATALYLQRHPQYADMDIRFDAVIVTSKLRPQHIEGAWDLSW